MTDLQPPGAGLPGFERAMLNVMLRISSAFMSDSRAMKLFATEADELVRLYEASDLDDVSEQVLIPRIQGIEDSSRDWSVLMVLQHLCLVNRDMMKVVSALKQGIVPRGEVAIEFYKPDPDVGPEIIGEFRAVTLEYQRLIGSLGNLRTAVEYRHPWFGLLDAHRWHCLAAAHQRIHRRQAQRILATLGVV